jgi:3-isopropylmalate/(R)-2-methylmalate dehydratase large subunit
MGMTIAEKILARAGGLTKVSPGDLVVADVDTVMFNDTTFYPGTWREILHVFDPAKIVVVFDHRVPAPDRACAQMHVTGREFCRRFGITRLHDVGYDQGISHVIVAQNAYALPGTIIVCSDSHTGAAGAFNCAGRGIGVPDVVHAATTGKTWFQAGATVRYDLIGALRPGVATKDVFLHIAQTYGDHYTFNIEYGGPGVSGLSLDARRTLRTMGTELNAEFSIFEPDDVLLAYMHERTTAPFEPRYPDADARYEAKHSIDLDRIEPFVALPDSIIRNARPVSELTGERIHHAFIGSCANGNLDDLAIAARVVAGRRVAPSVRLLVTPGSQATYRQALEAGYVATLLDAGAVVTNATCGACGGGHMGVLGPNETCITASTRNFKGRMGDPSARIYMASPATVAASAIAGTITHPGTFLGAEATP